MAKSETKGAAPKLTFELTCASQGVPTRTMSQRQLVVWLAAEMRLWESADIHGDVAVNGLANYPLQLGPAYIRLLSNVLSAVERGELEPLGLYMTAAESLSVLILQSQLGASVLGLDDRDRPFMATVFSLGAIQSPNSGFEDHFRQLRSVFAVNPLLSAGVNLSEAKLLGEALSETLRKSGETLDYLKQRLLGFEGEHSQQLRALTTAAKADRDQFAEWFSVQRKELEATRDIYHKHVQTEAAAKFWQHKAWISTGIAWAAFAAFGAMVSFAFWLGLTNLEAIKSYVASLASDNSTVSLTPVVVIAVPVLAYAWVLRHLSRVFIQNLTIADDAAYRRLMTMTFLGLSHDPKSGVTQAERAIILNALFRPAPPNTTEDGPPSGLLDIITKKS